MSSKAALWCSDNSEPAPKESMAQTAIRKATYRAASDMREDGPRNPFAFDTAEYWAYANEVNRAFTEDLRRAI